MSNQNVCFRLEDPVCFYDKSTIDTVIKKHNL